MSSSSKVLERRELRAADLGARLRRDAGLRHRRVCRVRRGRADRPHRPRRARFILLGGDLAIEWNEADNHVYMTGPAVEVFSGEWHEQ